MICNTLWLTQAGFHKYSIAYVSDGVRRHNQAFRGTPYGPEFVQGDVIGVGYRPRSGTIFFTRNGKKLDDVAHGLKTQNFFPTIGANGPCQVHVNFGQLGFVFIEANVKKWGLAPASGSLAPPPPYGSEQGDLLLEGGREGTPQPSGQYIPHALLHYTHVRSSSAQLRLGIRPPTSPGPQRSPTDISLAQLSLVDSHEANNDDGGEGSSTTALVGHAQPPGMSIPPHEDAPPDYESPNGSPTSEQPPRINPPIHPPIPSYDAAVAESRRTRREPR